MPVRNRQGEPVDPIPFAVIASVAWLLCLSFGPLYLDAFSVPWARGVLVSVAVAVGMTVWAYRRFIWTVDPTVRRELSVGLRFRQICYGAIIFGVVLLLLTVFAVANGG
ncbi:MAG: hypothetical protein ABEI27_01165 [Halobellus sp.]|uniref:hypothetical protein n=1 Tax=Halobellus sp. TaxID=1979212 RepID=UPI0035D432B1